MRTLLVVAASAIICVACSSDGTAGSGVESVAAGSTEATIASASAEPDTDAVQGDPAVEPGALSEGQFEIGETSIDYVAITPPGFSIGDTAPVLLAFPPGNQDFDVTRSVAEQTYLNQAVQRGWVVISPAAPVGEPAWFDGSEQFVPSILDWIETWVGPEGGSVHVAGVSNGGLSAFAVAAIAPDRVQSILVFPGFPRSDEALAALPELVGVPVRMFVGGEDTGWIEPMQSTFDTLTDLGVDVTFDVMAGEGHIIASLRDGVRLFDELDANRSTP